MREGGEGRREEREEGERRNEGGRRVREKWGRGHE